MLLSPPLDFSLSPLVTAQAVKGTGSARLKKEEMGSGNESFFFLSCHVGERMNEDRGMRV